MVRIKIYRKGWFRDRLVYKSELRDWRGSSILALFQDDFPPKRFRFEVVDAFGRIANTNLV